MPVNAESIWVLGRCASPCLSSHFTARLALTAAVGNGHVTRSPATLNYPHVRLASGAPSASSGSHLGPVPGLNLGLRFACSESLEAQVSWFHDGCVRAVEPCTGPGCAGRRAARVARSPAGGD